MITVRAAAVATQFIGVIWALLALLFRNDQDDTAHEFGVSIAVIAAGFAVWLYADWRER